MEKEILDMFLLPEDNYDVTPYGNGHINATFLVQGKRKRFILQKINDEIFRDIEGLMHNISEVCCFIEQVTRRRGGDVDKCLMPVKAKDGKSYVRSNGGYWRVYNYIEGTVAIEMPLNAQHFGEGGRCLARFAEMLSSFDAGKLVDVIPGFHDTPARVEKLSRSFDRDAFGRRQQVLQLYDFAMRRAPAAGVVTDGVKKALIPLRVTHNDTKFNNMLFDAVTKKPVVVIDLDTVMKGSVLYDFGDAVRIGCNAAREDEQDTDKVRFLKDYYDCFKSAYQEVLGSKFTKEEKRLLDFSAMLMTYECGVRFLTDYLDGDVYFRTHYDRQNLYRARTQFRLVEEMEKIFAPMTQYASGEGE